jgi:ribonuclease D
MNLINTTEELNQACILLNKQKIIAIDCEFIREKTYYPIPCLIQIGYKEGAFLVDPLAKEVDFSNFFDLLQNKSVLKIFHSGRQDIEILYNLSGKVPTPIFDTQIAAQACGLGESVSYENLVRIYCNQELDKSCRLTNWQMRPLTEEQLEYAAGDVTHLITCYEQIARYLKENKREKWIAEDMSDLIDESHYKINPEDAWLRIRHNSHSTLFLNTLKALATWRENRAIQHNTSRQSVIKDEMLVNIATAHPKNLEEMQHVRGMRSDISRGVLAKEMLEILTTLNTAKLDKKLCKADKEKDVSLTMGQQSLYEVLRLLLKIKSNEYGVVPHLITSEKNLREYIKDPKADKHITKGWRYEVFGQTAELLSQGKIGITYDPSSKEIVVKEL